MPRRFNGRALAGSTLYLTEPTRHPTAYFARHAHTIHYGDRFYMGAPVTTPRGKVVLGTLCLEDARPHDMHGEDMRVIEHLALDAMVSFHLLQNVHDLRHRKALLLFFSSSWQIPFPAPRLCRKTNLFSGLENGNCSHLGSTSRAQFVRRRVSDGQDECFGFPR